MAGKRIEIVAATLRRRHWRNSVALAAIYALAGERSDRLASLPCGHPIERN